MHSTASSSSSMKSLSIKPQQTLPSHHPFKESARKNIEMKSIQDPSLELFDIDCNLTHDDLRDNVIALIEQSVAVGVKEMLVPGSNIEDSQRCIELCRQHPTQLFPTAGVHPYFARTTPSEVELSALKRLVEIDDVRAVGECGLDYSPGFPERILQMKWFAEQLMMACAIKKPLFLHQRLAHQDFTSLIDRTIEESNGYFPPAVVHCFTGNEEELKAYIARGDDWYIGITGYICKKEGAALKGMVKHRQTRLTWGFPNVDRLN
ncbi:hypothetical protein CCR75_003617 [Bremia lactucae]|uniref:TatD related DNase n=1 Tax=Bremia lactucae TaxID=4779 RepID=A0A976FFI3_BRELC|nr:hypothetical protein CCR75_003617 [Bremia lactucae]